MMETVISGTRLVFWSAFIYSLKQQHISPFIWNYVHRHVRNSSTKSVFRHKLRTLLLTLNYIWFQFAFLNFVRMALSYYGYIVQLYCIYYIFMCVYNMPTYKHTYMHVHTLLYICVLSIVSLTYWFVRYS